MTERLNVGIYLFENMTMLDGYAPLQILSFVPQFQTFTFASEKKLLRSDCGALLTPDYDFASCPPLDLLIVPGAGDILPQLSDARVLANLRRLADNARYITSVCTGALVLAEAGLLEGYRATTHWGWMKHLATYPNVTVVDQRVVVDRDRITGGGVTAGIDFALTLIAEIVGVPVAQAMQLIVEYRPEPPFNAGSPTTAPAEVIAQVMPMVRELEHGLGEFLARKRA